MCPVTGIQSLGVVYLDKHVSRLTSSLIETNLVSNPLLCWLLETCCDFIHRERQLPVQWLWGHLKQVASPCRLWGRTVECEPQKRVMKYGDPQTPREGHGFLGCSVVYREMHVHAEPWGPCFGGILCVAMVSPLPWLQPVLRGCLHSSQTSTTTRSCSEMQRLGLQIRQVPRGSLHKHSGI